MVIGYNTLKDSLFSNNSPGHGEERLFADKQPTQGTTDENPSHHGGAS
jgi:hypothetical protein